MVLLNIEKEAKYHTIDLIINGYNKDGPRFTLLYTDEKIAIIEASETRKAILGTYSVSFDGSDQKLTAVTQGYLSHDIFLATSKDKVIKLRFDLQGQVSFQWAFKIPDRKENTCIRSISQCDNYLFLGLDNGMVQVYYIQPMGLLQSFPIFGSHIIIGHLIVKKSDF